MWFIDTSRLVHGDEVVSQPGAPRFIDALLRHVNFHPSRQEALPPIGGLAETPVKLGRFDLLAIRRLIKRHQQINVPVALSRHFEFPSGYRSGRDELHRNSSSGGPRIEDLEPQESGQWRGGAPFWGPAPGVVFA